MCEKMSHNKHIRFMASVHVSPPTHHNSEAVYTVGSDTAACMPVPLMHLTNGRL